jgi:hypothetical protein
LQQLTGIEKLLIKTQHEKPNVTIIRKTKKSVINVCNKQKSASTVQDNITKYIPQYMKKC